MDVAASYLAGTNKGISTLVPQRPLTCIPTKPIQQMLQVINKHQFQAATSFQDWTNASELDYHIARQSQVNLSGPRHNQAKGVAAR
jgi:hypothetical protein